MEAAAGGQGIDEPFEVSASPETAAERPEHESANVCRVAALAMLLGDSRGASNGLAGTRQRMPHRPNVTQVIFGKWFLGHSASHEERVWTDESIANRAGL